MIAKNSNMFALCVACLNFQGTKKVVDTFFNVNITFRGVTKTIAQWAETLGINYGTLRTRIVTRKWSIDRALTQEIGNQGGNYASRIIPMS